MHSNLLFSFRRFFSRYKLEEVFTPGSSARLTFIKRKEIQDLFDKNLLLPGIQLIIYGHSGSGKTTQINNSLDANKIKFITTSCINTTTIDDIILDAFDRLNLYYLTAKEKKVSAKISPELKASFLSIDTTIKSEIGAEKTEKYQRVLPPQLTIQRLAEFIGAAGLVWVIEDFHKVKKEHKQTLSQIFKLFVDLANRYPKSKIIAVGAVDTARQIVDYDKELNNRVAEINIPLLKNEELTQIARVGFKLLNIKTHYKIEHELIKYSASLASICHSLCFNMCHIAKIKKESYREKVLDNQDFRNAVEQYIRETSDSFKQSLERALKLDSENKNEDVKMILLGIIKITRSKDACTAKEINDEIWKIKYNYNLDQIRNTLVKLCSPEFDEIIRFDLDSGKFSFNNPFFKAYVTMYINNESTNINPINPVHGFVKLLLNLIANSGDGDNSDQLELKF